MRIERIYIYTSRLSMPFLRCCVASIRTLYPDIPITLVKNDDQGAFDTNETETYWQTDVMETELRQFHRGCGKIEPLLQDVRERCLILDDDTVFFGKVLDRLEQYDEDFVVNSWDRFEHVEDYWFRLDLLRAYDPAFNLADHLFNTGQFVATTGLLTRTDFTPFVTFADSQRLLLPDVFLGGDQGFLNYVILKKFQEGRISLRRTGLMWWPEAMKAWQIPLDDLGSVSSPVILHWAGPKTSDFGRMPLGYVLAHFDKVYYDRIPRGRLLHHWRGRVRTLPHRAPPRFRRILEAYSRRLR